MALKIILFETGSGKWVRFHDVPAVQFTSNRDQATRIHEKGGVREEFLSKIIKDNKLEYLMKTLEFDFDMEDETGNVIETRAGIMRQTKELN